MCPAGTFSSSTGLVALSGCTLCTAGYYCPANGQTSVDTTNNKCTPGYICAAGSIHPRQVLCPKGYVCPNTTPAAWDKQPCQNDATGEYMDETGGITCKICPAGYICYSSTSTAANVPKDAIMRCTPQNTALSFYCPAGQAYSVPCPAGTYTF